MTTMANLVADARRMAYGSMSETINLVAAPYTAGDVDLNLELDVTGITPGTILSCGLNVWWVKSVDTSTKTVYVVNSFDDSPNADAAVGDIVYVRPRATAWYLFTTMQDVIRSLSSPSNGLYKIGTWTTDVDPTYQTYPIPVAAQDATGIIGARVLSPAEPDVWFDIPKKAILWQDSQNIVRVTRNLPAGTSVEFRYKGPFTVPTALTDDPIAVCGLTSHMLDIPALGTVVTLLRTTEGRREQVQSQGDSRRPGEVGQGANLNAAREFERDFKSRVGEEASRLISQDPYRQDF